MKQFPIQCLVVALMLLGLAPTKARALDLWPFAEFSEERTMVLPPFYIHEGDFLMAFPFYYRTNYGRDHHFLWPLVKTSEGRLTRLAPFWFSADADTFTIFPLIRQTPDYTLWSVPPVYTRHDGKFNAVYPLYAKSPNMLYVAPSFYKYKNGDVEYHGFAPLYFGEKTSTYRKEFVPVLYYNWRSADEQLLWLLPGLYHSIKKPDIELKESALLPVFYNSLKNGRDGREREFMLLPVVFYHSKSGNAGNENNLWLLPFLRGSSSRGSYHGILPLYFYRNESMQGDQRETFNLFWPVYRWQVTKSPSGKVLDYHHRFLFFSESKNRDGSRVFRLLGIPIQERTR